MRHLAILVLVLALFASSARANFSLGQNLFAAGDYAGALQAWRPLAEAGDVRAQYSLGVIYEKGLGVPRDLPRAIEWYRHAANHGYAPAIAALRTAKGRLEPPPSITPKPKPALVPSTPPPAAEADERDRIEQLVREIMRQADLQFRAGTLEHGNVKVARTAAGHLAEIEGVAVSRSSGGRVDVGTVRLEFVADGARYYRITPRLPAVMRLYEPGGGAPSELRIGRQAGAVLWDRDLEIVIDLDARLGEVEVVAPDGQRAARFGEIAMTTELVERAGRWSGPIGLTIRDFAASAPDGGGFKLDGMSLVARVENLDMALYAHLSCGHGDDGRDAEDLLRSFGRLLSGFSLSFGFDDLAASPSGGRPARMKRLDYEVALSGIDRDLASLAMRYGHRGLDGEAPILPRHVPREAGLALTLDRLPIKTVVKAGLAALLEYWFFGKVASSSAVYNELRTALTAAGTELRIKDGTLTAPDYLVQLAGIFAADTRALWGISGEVGLTIAGLDGILAGLRNGEAAPKPDTPSLATLLRRLGRPSIDGKTMSYDITVDRAGKILVNGENSIPLIAALFAS